MKKNVNVGIVADWLVTYAGAENVISEFIKIFPNAELYSVVDFLSKDNRIKFMNKKSTTSFIQKLPLAKKKYQKYLPLMPLAIEQLDVSQHNLILSSSHAVSKGVITGPDQLHICYVHSPLRYAWDMQHQYLKGASLDKGVKSFIARYILHKMRMWDVRTSNGVDHFIANSKFVARRIKKVYGRDSDVIYPPVDVDRFTMKEKKEDFYITASRLVPYKRVDLIAEAFSLMPDKLLYIIGDGPEMEKIKKLAKDNIRILGYQSDEFLQDHMERAKAFVFAAEEDFGIIPVEAQACGTPVIAYGKGGALETIISDFEKKPTGIHFQEQTKESLIEAINIFEKNICLFTPLACRKNAEKFSRDRFNIEMKKYIDEKVNAFNKNLVE